VAVFGDDMTVDSVLRCIVGSEASLVFSVFIRWVEMVKVKQQPDKILLGVGYTLYILIVLDIRK
jgi:hypothetical protein